MPVYQVIGDGLPQLFQSVTTLTEFYHVAGYCTELELINSAETYGEPILKGFVGPIFNGTNIYGQTIIRYETQIVYNTLGMFLDARSK